MQKISILTFCLFVLTNAQQQPQILQQAPQILQPTPQSTPQPIPQSIPQPTPQPVQNTVPKTKNENERVSSPFNVINTMYDVTPLRVKVFNWFSSWFSTPTMIG